MKKKFKGNEGQYINDEDLMKSAFKQMNFNSEIMDDCDQLK